MENRLETTGERLIAESYRETLGGYVIYLMHMASYRFSEPYCRGKVVLDLGCGSGYGAAEVAKIARHVSAVDVSAEAVDYAKAKFGSSSLDFLPVFPGAALPFPDRHFDVVLSFQVIEHVEDDIGYLREAARVLKDDGTLILITPDRLHRLLPGQRPWNRWHLREYRMEALEEIVSEVFHVANALRMGATTEVARIELRRYGVLKWITLPFTFPCAPEVWRQLGLNLMQRFNRPVRSDKAKPFVPKFGVEAINIAPEVSNSLNLVLVGNPKRFGSRATGDDSKVG